ncbi:ATP-grasp domain-containing protein [Paraliomyxa miuraensis]|uniref:ATP-grasp domain-containing protein n=1 Tax=Paraliomyxa miuraensis TaxID=376150 RepID=UPI00225540FE|nr:ATP-grasp domain-containing protein [Paraliomyxa miuraensis]MCX4241330.1 ATP-grasp domain-containing protein [Paraliomyxa miuraensis]
MRHVALVAPRFLTNTLRYVSAFLELPDARVSLISEDPEINLPPALRERIAGHYGVDSCLQASELVRACQAIHEGVGPIDRLCGVLEQLQLAMAQARDEVGIEGMSLSVARNFRDKDRMKEVLRGAGVPVARSALVTSPEQLHHFADRVGFPIVVKPPAGLGARATFRIGSPEQLQGLLALGLAPSPTAPAQAEEFVVGREFTCETVTIHGKPVWRSGTRYFPGPLEVLENPWMQYVVVLPREADDPTWREFDAINGAALEALGIGTALTHMEWFRRHDGSMLVNEVGARPPGVLIMPLMSVVHETDMIAAWAELMTFDRFEPRPRKWAAAAAFLRGQGRGDRVVAVHGWEQARELVGDALVEASLPAIGQPRAEGYEGEGHAIVRHATTEGAQEAVRQLITHVRVELG